MSKIMISYARAFLRKHSWFVAIFQALLISCSLLLAWSLRFDYALPDRRMLFQAAPILIAVRLLLIWRFGLLHGWWKYTGASDILDVAKAVISGSAIFVLVVHIIPLAGFPRSIFLLEAILTAGFLAGVR